MEVLLISSDERLFKLCSEVLSEWKRDRWSLSAATEFPAQADFDLYIWDCQPERGIPAYAELRESGKHLFVVHRMDLGWFRNTCGSGDETILLKPVTRAALSAFVQHSLAAPERSRVMSHHATRADRDDLFQSLIEANLRLQEYDQDRTNFLARAVHDFRAPLTAISGYCGLFLDGSLGPLDDQQQEVLRRMEHSAHRLYRLSSAMFELSVGPRIERRERLVRADITECAAHAIDVIQPVLQEKRIKLTVDLQPPAHALYLEPEQIEQVLVNLLDNAAKFTPRQGSVQVLGYGSFWERRSPGRRHRDERDRRHAKSGDPNCYRMDVIDSGRGIPSEHLGRIFEEYAQVYGGEDRSGAGLGLAICRMILSRHDGAIWADSSGQGASFSFVLPFGGETAAQFAETNLLERACSR